MTSTEHAQLTSRAAMLSLAVALTLIALKTWAWLVSGSVAMLASLADSALDLAASLITYFAVRYAAAPPDREHRYGHGKAEAFAGLLQGGLVGVSGVVIATEAAPRLFAPAVISHGLESIAVMLVSIALTAGLVAYQTHAVRRTGSVATRADRLHYAGDLAANAVVLAGIGAGVYLGVGWADPAAALLVAAWLLYGALKVAREAADHLLDREVADDVRARIRALAEEDARILRVHELRTRTSGPYLHIQFHAELDPDLSLEAAHKIVVAAESRIRAEFPTADIIIHPDPKGRAEPHGHEHFERAHGH
ncbi:MAG TPA: cation diffusion facilitator family transporter [Candidatus Binatia bacterium]|nr:cation diffusion facilitator family transporter [Candidatus Binatia bacterium]